LSKSSFGEIQPIESIERLAIIIPAFGWIGWNKNITDIFFEKSARFLLGVGRSIENPADRARRQNTRSAKIFFCQ
jgi:hypothetical protein